MILLLFFLSGGTALVYEVIWSKYLALMFGSTVQAQTVVLAVFMGGLALGNWGIGSRADHLKKPLRAYGILEVIVGLLAFFFQSFYSWSDSLFIGVGSHLTSHLPLLALKGSISVLLLLPPTILMGGTLPLLASWLQKYDLAPERKSARFYAINSLGAVLGAGLGGFFFVQFLGLIATLQFMGLVNIVLGLCAMAISRSSGELVRKDGAEQPDGPRGESLISWNSAIGLVTLSGAVSMGLEILASRSLGLIFGSSLQAFSIVLMGFILGIGLGGAFISSAKLSRMDLSKAVLAALIGAAAVVGVLVCGLAEWVDIYRHIRTGLAQTPMGYRLQQVLIGIFSIIILGIPAGLIGAILPICMRIQGEQAVDLGKRVGRLLTWNTVGAVSGVLLTGFVLMPMLGVRGAFLLLAGLLAFASLLLAGAQKRKIAFAAGVVIGALLLGVTVGGGSGWRHVLSSGVFRARETVVNEGTMARRQEYIKLLFYEDAPDATVTVEQGDGIVAPADVGLRINGKPDASAEGDLSSQLLVAQLPIFARPESKDVFVVGFGSGISAGSLLGHPIEHLDIAENCEPVLRAGRLFERWNRGVLTNSRVKIWNEDARTVLKLSPKKYDVIISQPSNPWMAGVGSVFSRDYYQLAATRLKEGGIMAQWFQIYEMNDGIVSFVLRTFGSVFPHMEVWDASGGDIVLLGSLSPWKGDVETYSAAFARPIPRADLEHIGITSVQGLLARQFASQRSAHSIAGEGGIQSDGFPVLEYEAPKAFFIGTSARELARFDERTWQQGLMSEAKRSALQTLSDQDVLRIFSRGTMNPELMEYFNHKIQAQAQLPATNVAAVPVVFAHSNPPSK